MEEAQVREALAQVNEVWRINGEKNEGKRDEQIDPNAGPYNDNGDEYYLDDDQYYYDEGQWLPESFVSENWGGEENHEHYGNDFFEDQGDQKWPTDE
uniref:Uncharacterized protein n=1 Tax=Meloidogyne hapla TaxID=6305 RepID=A0A1I8B9M7_MELHA